jgi:hypothetical protein
VAVAAATEGVAAGAAVLHKNPEEVDAAALLRRYRAAAGGGADVKIVLIERDMAEVGIGLGRIVAFHC